jgi:hypothetical protein
LRLGKVTDVIEYVAVGDPVGRFKRSRAHGGFISSLTRFFFTLSRVSEAGTAWRNFLTRMKKRERRRESALHHGSHDINADTAFTWRRISPDIERELSTCWKAASN